MSDTDYQHFRGVSHYGKNHLTNELEYGLKEWISWSFLKIGAWSNVTTGTSGVYGGNFSVLHKVHDSNYTDGTVYQAIRKDFIWETGINYISNTGTHNPLSIQIYANNTGITTGTAGFFHYIDYPNGRVVFNTVQSSNIVFRAQYSIRAIQTYLSAEQNWWYEVNYNSFNTADLQWMQNLTSGDYALAGSNRIQLPAVIIESTSRSNALPFELGTLTTKNYQDVLLHILSENCYERNNIADIFRLQKDKIIVLPDISKIYSSGLFPLDERGMVVNNPVMYPNIVGNQDLIFRHARLSNTSLTDVKTNHPQLHWSIIRATFEIIY